MITPGEAWQAVLRHVAPLPVETLPLGRCLHRVVAEDVLADRDIPQADRSAMDGYAVRAEDVAAPPARLQVVGEIAAGSDAAPVVADGQCARIFTGANVPPGADTVVRQEDTEESAGGDSPWTERYVTVMAPIPEVVNIFRRGENAVRGAVLIPAGTPLNPVHIGLCATVGCDVPRVYRNPRVSIVTTGAELKGAGESIGSHEIRDSNGPMLAAVLEQHRFGCAGTASAVDDIDVLAQTLANALEASDVILITGGVSVGKYDLVPDAIGKAGGEIVYHGVLMKPGKPQLFAVFPSGKCAFALPGNPLSAMTGMQEFALPAMRRLAGMPVEQCRPLMRLPIAVDLDTEGDRYRHVLGRLVPCETGLHVEPLHSSGSADLISAGRAHGAIMVPPGGNHITKSAVVDFRPWWSVS